MKYSVQPLLTGFFTVAFKGDEIMKFPRVNNIPSFIFLLTSENGENIIVDTGFDVSHVPGPDSTCSRNPGQDIPELLKSRNIDTSAIRTVIQTHLHWDHAAGIKFFSNAEIIVQAAEIEGLFSLVNFEETSFVPHHWYHALDRFRLIDGDCEIRPGLTLLQTGGHTKGHQGVKVSGKDKTIVLIGDSPFTYEWLWTLVPESYWDKYRQGEGRKFFWQDEYLEKLQEWYKINKPVGRLADQFRSVNELRSAGDISLFSHDPLLKGTELF